MLEKAKQLHKLSSWKNWQKIHLKGYLQIGMNDVQLANVLSTEGLFYACIIPFVAFFGSFAFILYPLRDIIHPTGQSHSPLCLEACLCKQRCVLGSLMSVMLFKMQNVPRCMVSDPWGRFLGMLSAHKLIAKNLLVSTTVWLLVEIRIALYLRCAE